MNIEQTINFNNMKVLNDIVKNIKPYYVETHKQQSELIKRKLDVEYATLDTHSFWTDTLESFSKEYDDEFEKAYARATKVLDSIKAGNKVIVVQQSEYIKTMFVKRID